MGRIFWNRLSLLGVGRVGPGSDMSRSDDYRHNAANCLAVAEQMVDPSARAVLIAMARSWHLLADQAERNSKTDLVYETPPPRPPQQPAAHQQQQIQPDNDKPES
jgi:hypothetical protein